MTFPYFRAYSAARSFPSIFPSFAKGNEAEITTPNPIDTDAKPKAKGVGSASASSITLAGDKPAHPASMTATLGGAVITNHAPWRGTWTAMERVVGGKARVMVPSATAMIVRYEWKPR